MSEFKRSVLGVLRQPIENGEVTISRAVASVAYPASFMLVAAVNPCPCGYLSDPRHTSARVHPDTYSDTGGASPDHSSTVSTSISMCLLSLTRNSRPTTRVNNQRRSERGSSLQGICNSRGSWGKDTLNNGQMKTKHIKRFCKLKEDAQTLLETAMQRFGLSGQGVCKDPEAVAHHSGSGGGSRYPCSVYLRGDSVQDPG